MQEESYIISSRNGLFRVRTRIDQSNLLIISDMTQAINSAIDSIIKNRTLLEDYIRRNPLYGAALIPIKVSEDAPKIVKLAAKNAELAQVGSMAAIPGALADLALEDMIKHKPSVALIENGGEIASFSKRPLNVGLYAGISPLSGRLGFKLKMKDFPIGISTSSATVSHAFSFGAADAAVIISNSAALSDAASTVVCNAVKGTDIESSIQKGLKVVKSIEGIRGALIIRGKYVGRIGDLPQTILLKGSIDEIFHSGYLVT